MLQTKQIVGALLLGGILLAMPSPSFAPPPPGGPPGQGGGGEPLTGTIYFRRYPDPPQIHSMLPDGSSKTALPANVQGDYIGTAPSWMLHGGHRWFLSIRIIPGEFYPYVDSGGNPHPRTELFAVREDGDELFTVRLTDQPDLQVLSGASWGIGDLEISWIARRWDVQTESVVDGGIYTSSILFDASGDVIGLLDQPAIPLVSEALVVAGDGTLAPDIGGHSWAPDATRICYATLSHELVIADLAAGTAETIPTSLLVYGPSWSPDGSKIAFTGGGGGAPRIATIKPDGSGEKQIAKGHGGSRPVNVTGPRWSPTGSHLVYRRYNPIYNQGRSDVIRAAAGGGGKTNLTEDIDTGSWPAYPIGWPGP